MNKFLRLFIATLIGVAMPLCGGSTTTENGENNGKATSETNYHKALNVSIYLDLSDRLERPMTPSQAQRDIEIVKYMAAIVKNHAVSQKILPSTDRIKVFFYPSPNDPKISLLSNDLELDLSKAQPAEKKKLLTEFEGKFNKSLTQIYNTTLKQKNWVGSDIWGFFKGQVDTYCIKKNARNIIVILTDGYIYDKNNIQKKGNNYSYILPKPFRILTQG